MDVNSAFFIEGRGTSPLPILLSKRARHCRYRGRGAPVVSMVRLFEPIIGAVLAAASVAQVPLLLKDRISLGALAAEGMSAFTESFGR